MNGFLTIATTALTSGAAAAAFSSALSEGKERWALRREKIELIYLGLDALSQHVMMYELWVAGYLKGSLNYDALVSLFKEAKVNRSEFISLRLNVHLYEPSLLESYHVFIKANDLVVAMCNLPELQKLNTEQSRSEYRTAFESAVAKRSNALFQLQGAVIQRGQQIASEPGQITLLFHWLANWLRGQR